MLLNVPHAYQTISGSAAVPMPELECNPGQLVWCTVSVHAVNGAPSAASLAVKWQVASLAVPGPYSIASEANSVQRHWVDVTTADQNVSNLLYNDMAWPASIASATSPAVANQTIFCSRRMYAPPLHTFVRVVLTPSFTLGTSPSFLYSVSYATP